METSPLSHIPLPHPFQHAYTHTENGDIEPCILLPVTSFEESRRRKCIVNVIFCIDTEDEMFVFSRNPTETEQQRMMRIFKQNHSNYERGILLARALKQMS